MRVLPESTSRLTRDGRLFVAAKHAKALRRALHEIATHGGGRFAEHFEYLGAQPNAAGYRWDQHHRLLMPVVMMAGPGSRLYRGAAPYAHIDDPPATFYCDPERTTN